MMNAMWVLVIVLTYNGQVAVTTQEFLSRQTCETAKESIRANTGGHVSYTLLTCEKK